MNTAVSTAGSIVAVVSPAPRALLLVSLVGLAASFRAPHRVIEVAMSEYTRAADVAVGDVVIVWRGDSKLEFTRRFRHAELERHAGAPCAFTRSEPLVVDPFGASPPATSGSRSTYPFVMPKS